MAVSEWSGTLDGEAFLSRYWQRAPLLVRSAVSDWTLPIDLRGLRELATREDLPSRWIALPDEDRSWEVRSGPFSREFFDRLPQAGWTLLVQEIDRHVEGFATLLERFRFVPNWRIDDVMVSYATDGAGVGPHTDRYDVFLFQADGRRRWRIAERAIPNPRLRADTGLPVLQEFPWDHEWILEPGDLLYLPPQVAHEGVAIGPGFTCSIGFRAPDPRELLAGYLRSLAPIELEQVRYRDPDLGDRTIAHVGEIPLAARQRIRVAVRELFESEEFDRWLGRMVTTPHRNAGPARRESPAAEDWPSCLDSGGRLRRSSPSHFSWMRESDGKVLLFVGGEPYPLGRRAEATAELICGREVLDAGALSSLRERGRMVRILQDLVARGYLIPTDCA